MTRSKKIIADPSAKLGLVALGSGLLHLVLSFILRGPENFFYTIFFFAASAALITALYRTFLRRRRKR